MQNGIYYLIQGVYLLMNRYMKGESLVGLLVAITLFSLLLLIYQQWQQQQNQNMARIFQQQQALQIAENQLALQLANQPCESQAVQNQQTFTIQCNGGSIQVAFPLGKVEIKP